MDSDAYTAYTLQCDPTKCCRSKACKQCFVLPVSVPSCWLGAWLLMLMLSWTVFAIAAVYSIHDHVNMKGFEWVPGLLVTAAIIPMTGIRSGGDGYGREERDQSETERCVRAGLVFALVCSGVAFALIMLPIQWFGLFAAGPVLDGAMGLHTTGTPTPSPAPVNTEAVDERRNTVGALLILHLLCAIASVGAYWQYTATHRLRQERIDRGEDESELTGGM